VPLCMNILERHSDVVLDAGARARRATICDDYQLEWTEIVSVPIVAFIAVAD
jgi:hypothetical protein